MASKYIVTLENEKTFNSHKFDHGRLAEKSTIRFYPLNYKSRIEFVKKIYRAKIAFSDEAIDMAGLRSEQKKAYFLEYGSSSRLLPYKNTIWNALTIEVSLDEREFDRQVYSFLDMLGDVGGLFGALGPVCAILVTIF